MDEALPDLDVEASPQLVKRHAKLAVWLAQHPRAWDGWPTTASPIATEPALHHARARRLFEAGCPPSLAREVVAANNIIAQIRMDKRRAYAEAVRMAV